jgi:hypothetical protein
MNITIGKLLESSQHLGKLFTADVKITTAFTIKRNISAINVVLADFEAAKKCLIEKYADKDDKGEFIVENNSYTFKKNGEAFGMEMGTLLKTEVDIDIKQIPISLLEKVEVSAIALASYEFMITE